MQVDVNRTGEHVRANRLETGLLDYRRDGRRREEFDQPSSGGGVFRALDDRGREDRDLLRAFRQRTNDGDARHGTQLADLLEADLHVAARDRVADALVGFDDLALRLQLLGDAKARKQNGTEVHAACAVRGAHRLGLQQRALERIDGADIRLRRAGAHRHGDQRTHEIDAAARLHLSLLDQLVEPRRREDDHVDRLAAIQAIRNRVRRCAHRRAERADHVNVRVAFEPRRELLVRLGKPAGGDDVDFLRRGGGRNEQRCRRKCHHPGRVRSPCHIAPHLARIIAPRTAHARARDPGRRETAAVVVKVGKSRRHVNRRNRDIGQPSQFHGGPIRPRRPWQSSDRGPIRARPSRVRGCRPYRDRWEAYRCRQSRTHQHEHDTSRARCRHPRGCCRYAC